MVKCPHCNETFREDKIKVIKVMKTIDLIYDRDSDGKLVFSEDPTDDYPYTVFSCPKCEVILSCQTTGDY